jgi:hypothetical protein
MKLEPLSRSETDDYATDSDSSKETDHGEDNPQRDEVENFARRLDHSKPFTPNLVSHIGT